MGSSRAHRRAGLRHVGDGDRAVHQYALGAYLESDRHHPIPASDSRELPFPNDYFDLVLSTMTFHHWQEQERGIAEVARVINTGRSMAARGLRCIRIRETRSQPIEAASVPPTVPGSRACSLMLGSRWSSNDECKAWADKLLSWRSRPSQTDTNRGPGTDRASWR
jgi:SAM-dependent methyltransferase